MGNLEELKELWMRSFGDTKEYADFYFSRRYKPEYTFTAVADGKIVSAAQFFPYEVAWGKRGIKAVYILGVCTHPDYRRRGYVGKVLQDGINAAKAGGAELAFLIPQEPWLFDIYRKYGFTEMFYVCEEILRREDFCGIGCAGGVEILTLPADLSGVYEFYNSFLRKELDAAVIKTPDDFAFAIDELYARGSSAAIFCRNKKITGFAAYDLEDGNCVVKEILCADAEAKAALLALAFELCSGNTVAAYWPAPRFSCQPRHKALGMGLAISPCVENLRGYANLLLN